MKISAAASGSTQLTSLSFSLLSLNNCILHTSFLDGFGFGVSTNPIFATESAFSAELGLLFLFCSSWDVERERARERETAAPPMYLELFLLCMLVVGSWGGVYVCVRESVCV